MARAKKRRVLSGLGAARKTKKRTAKKAGCKRVSRKAAQRKVGGRTVLKKGCTYLKGDGARCCPTGGTHKKRGTKKRTAKKTGSKKTATKRHVYSAKSPLPFKKGRGGKKVLKKTCSRISSGKDKGKIACKRKMSRRRKAA